LGEETAGVKHLVDHLGSPLWGEGCSSWLFRLERLARLELFLLLRLSLESLLLRLSLESLLLRLSLESLLLRLSLESLLLRLSLESLECLLLRLLKDFWPPRSSWEGGK